MIIMDTVYLQISFFGSYCMTVNMLDYWETCHILAIQFLCSNSFIFTGPPDAPLDVQVELGPKPGVLLITWLPVTIDAAGTSNGVRVTGYAVYADGQKVIKLGAAVL